MSAEVTLKSEDWICLAECDERPEIGELVLLRFSNGEYEACHHSCSLLEDWEDHSAQPTHYMPLPTPDVPGVSK